MTSQSVLILAIIGIVAILLITDRIRSDLIALLTLIALGLTGLVSPADLFSGFSRSAVITIMALFIITAGLERTGATQVLGRHLAQIAGKSEARAVAVIMTAAATLSLVMNTIASTAVLLPLVVGLARQTHLKLSKLLMPLAFGSLLGGMATIFTTANILVSSALVDNGYQPYGIFDFFPIGLPMAVAGVIFMAVVGRKMLPAHSLGGVNDNGQRIRLSEMYGLPQAVSSVYIKQDSQLAGRTLAEGAWASQLGLIVVGITRKGKHVLAPSPKDQVLEGDVVSFTGTLQDQDQIDYGLVRTKGPDWHHKFISGEIGLVEAALAPRSPFAGKTLTDLKFREKFNLSVLALWREGKTHREGLGTMPLRFGDALLLQGSYDRIELFRDEPGLIVFKENVDMIPPGPRAWLAVGLTAAAVTLSALNILPIAEATFAAAVFMVLSGCLTMDEAYHAIEWQAIFLIAGMLPLGFALSNAGTASLIGDLLVNLVGQGGALALAGGLFLAAMLLTQVIGGQTTAVVLSPIAIAAAQSLQTDPRAISIAVAVACSTAFLTPFGHPSNVLVMGPGGYTIRDYTRVGLLLTALLFVVMLVSLAVSWGV
ncbi:MAG: SLC13 family permease [Anaerolineales bacterium]|nr:SLC13 family permease [Anaerolineales bacterium]